MNGPRVILELDAHGEALLPGETLSGQFSVEHIAEQDLRAIELSVLWHTEGKGDEDMFVHHFERIEQRPGESRDPRLPQKFSTVLPNSPLSYQGAIVKIRWCVRARAFVARGRELSAEAPFQLGEVPSVVWGPT